MITAKSNCIVIPVYKHFEQISETERLSLHQCFKVLGKHQIYFIGPDDLDLTGFINEAGLFSVNAASITFDNTFFKSISGYNKLLISKHFYKRFKDYEYMLIYQTDAFVFRDELNYWCNLGYDYIGAPWFENWHEATPASKFIGVGNGGFSLRRMSSFIRVLNTFSYLTPIKSLIKEFFKKVSYKSLFSLLRDTTIGNNTFFAFNNFKYNEDTFWGEIVNNKFKWYTVPNLDIALKFAMEVNAPSLYKVNNKQLPFGCHAWERYHYDFWQPFIYRNHPD